GLVDEDQTFRLDAVLIFAPLHPPARDVGTVAFAGHHGFFEAQLLGVDEVPDCTIIDLEATLGQFGDQSAQGKVPYLGALQQPGAVLARDCLRFVPAHLPWRNAAGLTQAPYPDNRRADAHAELCRGLMAGQASVSTPATTRSRRSIEYGLPIHA